MAEGNPNETQPPARKIRWWPAILILAAATAGIVWVRAHTEWAFQKRNLTAAPIILIAAFLLLVWWTFFSRVRLRLRLAITFGFIGLLAVGAALFRIRGVS